MKIRDNVYAYITRCAQLLVFLHVDFPEAGIQVPGGTMEAGELPEVAVLREAIEETGLETLQLVSYLGSDEVHLSNSNTEEIHLRHFYHLMCAQEVPETWQHYEDYPSQGSADPILFYFYLLPLTEAAEILHPYFSARLTELLRSMAGDSPKP